MKKTLYILAAILAAAACNKVVDDGSDIDIAGSTIFKVDTEQIDLIDGQSFRDTWAEGTSLGVFGDEEYANVPYVLKRDGIGKSEAFFYGPLVKGEKILAYCPYSTSAELENGMLPVTLAPVQHFDATASATDQFLLYSPNVVASADADNVMHFRYPFGIMAVQIQFDDAMLVSSMTLSSEADGIAGRILVDADMSVHASSISGKSISLDIDTPVSTIDDGGHFTTFYFVLPPAKYPAKSLRLLVETATETMNLQLNELEVSRVAGMDFPICNVKVEASDIPGFTPADGYLE